MDATHAPAPGTLAPLSGAEAVLVGLAALAVVNQRTHIPRQIWALLWFAGTLTAVAAGGKWLILRS